MHDRFAELGRRLHGDQDDRVVAVTIESCDGASLGRRVLWSSTRNVVGKGSDPAMARLQGSRSLDEGRSIGVLAAQSAGVMTKVEIGSRFLAECSRLGSGLVLGAAFCGDAPSAEYLAALSHSAADEAGTKFSVLSTQFKLKELRRLLNVEYIPFLSHARARDQPAVLSMRERGWHPVEGAKEVVKATLLSVNQRVRLGQGTWVRVGITFSCPREGQLWGTALGADLVTLMAEMGCEVDALWLRPEKP